MMIRDFPEDLHRDLKVLAAQRGMTLKKLVEEILRAYVAAQAKK